MASGNGSTSAAWAWDEALCGVVPPLISPLNARGARVAAIVRRHVAAFAR